MGQRPNIRPPRWAWNAPGGVLEPAAGFAEVGYAIGQKPPAPWFNFHLNALGQWTSFLAGPSTTQWSRRTFPDPSTGVVRIAVDTVSPDDDEARYRYVVAGVDGTGAFVAVSRRGAVWVTRRNLPGTPLGLAYARRTGNSYGWFLWTADGLYEAEPDVASASINPLRNGSDEWLAFTMPGSSGTIADLCQGNGTSVHFVASTSTSLLYDVGGGLVRVAPVTRTQAGRAICWTGVNFVEISSDAGDGVVHTATGPAGLWTLAATLTGVDAGTTWRLAVGEAGVVVAFKTGAALPEMWRSANHGAAWTPVTTPAALRALTGLRWHEGVWVATSTVAPYAQTSSDLEHWLPLPLPLLEAGNELRDVGFADGAWLLVSRSGVLQGAPSIDPGTEGYTPGTEASIPVNAGWLRGYRISVTAPADGQALVWDGTEYVPTTPSASSYTVRTKTTTYTALAGDVLLCDATGGAFTITLPAAASVTGASITVKKIDATASAVTVDAVGSEDIDGAATRILSTQYESVTLWSDGSNWWVT